MDWLQRAQRLQRNLCPQVSQWFDHSAAHPEFEPLSRPTRLAYLLLAEHLASAQQAKGGLLFVGISGGQGAGKSTLVNFVSRLLCAQRQLSVQTLSLDDFYLSKARRQQLAEQTHPLFATRGVPGTHDIGLLSSVLNQLQQGGELSIPVFDKASDDVLPQSRWRQAIQDPDIVLLEGWCVGAASQVQQSLQQPVNKLEREKDGDGYWRRAVNRYLATDYQQLFARLDQLVYLQVPDMNRVRQWRYQQEPSGGLSRQQIEQFVQHFERLTLWMQQDLPTRADAVLKLGIDHQVAWLQPERGAKCHLN